MKEKEKRLKAEGRSATLTADKKLEEKDLKRPPRDKMVRAGKVMTK